MWLYKQSGVRIMKSLIFEGLDLNLGYCDKMFVKRKLGNGKKVFVWILRN